MTDEELCRRCKHYFEPPDQSSCWGCVDNDSFMDDKPTAATKPKPMTNGDIIRSMTDEELGKLLFDFGYEAFKYALKPNLKPTADTQEGWLNWLKQPYSEESNDTD